MRVVIDVLGAPESSGGMRLYAEELLRAWVELDTGDDLHVVGNEWVGRTLGARPRLRIHSVPEGGKYRIPGQWLYTPWIARRVRADAVMSVSMVASPLAGTPRVCVVHDWRHLKRPEEFSRWQRLYRRSWVWSVNRADAAIQISTKTDAETARIAPRARRTVVENGRDHAQRWRAVSRVGSDNKRIVTFGHHTNKRPELVIESLGLVATFESQERLVVLGARGEYANTLTSLASRLGLQGRVDFPGFVSDTEYQKIIQTASVVVLASTDEGFGLPVTEANFFGTPVVSTSDNGVDQIHPGRVIAVEPTVEALADALAGALTSPCSASSFPVATEGWAQTARLVRGVLEDAQVGRIRYGNRVWGRSRTIGKDSQ